MMEFAQRLLSKPASKKNTYLFNAAGAMMSAVTMVMIQMTVTRVLGAEWGGRVSADSAAVLLCYHLGQFSMRPYQCTDVKETFSFQDYLSLKGMMVGLMILFCLFYVLFRRLSAERILFTLSFLAYKALESFSDCFWGMFQQKGRLDLAGLGMAVYECFGTVSFVLCLILAKRPDFAALVMACFGLAHLLLYTLPIGKQLEVPSFSGNGQKIRRLFAILLPLFAAGYFMNIAITLPKYALEMSHGEEALGFFAAVYMPSQGVLLASSFFYNPRLRTLAQMAEEHRKKEFRRLLIRLILTIAILDLCIMSGAYLLGIPVLSGLFSLDLSPYRSDLLRVLLGGGFFAVYTLMSYALIAMRKEKGMAVLAGMVLVFAGVLCFFLADRFGIHGAVLSYLFSMVFAAGLFSLRTIQTERQMTDGRAYE